MVLGVSPARKYFPVARLPQFPPFRLQYGKQANGTQRYRCDNPDCPRVIFLLQYHDKGRLPAVKQQIIDMTLNGSGVRDIVSAAVYRGGI